MLQPTNNTADGIYQSGIGMRNRALLELLHRRLPHAFTVREASDALAREVEETRRLLAYFARRGWLSRVRRGLYVAVPLDARQSGEWREDPWVVAVRTFAPCYIGGWSACEHWGFTDQIFETVLVVSAHAVRQTEVVMQATRFRVTTRREQMLFGTVGVWRGQVRVPVSDPSRTMVDILDDPSLGGGIDHVADVLHQYLRSDQRSDEALVQYGDRLGNRSVFKRLGFLLERENGEVADLVAACVERKSTGLTKLDPSIESSGRILRRWGLRVNASLGVPGGDW
jgi:predicted transcriptional regulator of viral defense system